MEGLGVFLVLAFGFSFLLDLFLFVLVLLLWATSLGPKPSLFLFILFLFFVWFFCSLFLLFLTFGFFRGFVFLRVEGSGEGWTKGPPHLALDTPYFLSFCLFLFFLLGEISTRTVTTRGAHHACLLSSWNMAKGVFVLGFCSQALLSLCFLFAW